MELMNNDHAAVPLDPIRTDHIRDGQLPESDERGDWCLSIRTEGFVATIYPTTPTTCAWSIYRSDGRLLREASAREVQAAKDAAAEWILEHS